MTTPRKDENSIARRDFLKQSVVSAGAIGAAGMAGCGSVPPQGGPSVSDASGARKESVVRESRRRAYNGAYEGPYLSRVAFPLGGIGAGMICLEGTGALSHVSLRNRPDVFNEPCVFAAVCVKGNPNTARVLEGPVPQWKLFGLPGTGNGGSGKNYGLPRYRHARFETKFPFGHITLTDEAVPLRVEMTGWSPFEPGDADNSSLPVAGLEYRFTNTGTKAVEAVFSFNARNFLPVPNGTQSVASQAGGFMLCEAGPKDHPWDAATFSVKVTDDKAKVNAAWFRGGWFDSLTMTWKDVQDGACFDRPAIKEGDASPGATVFVPFQLAPGASKTVVVQLAWYAGQTNMRFGKDADTQPKPPQPAYVPWYAGRFANIDEVVKYWTEKYDTLRKNSLRFSDSFYDTTLPPEVVEAVAANLTILKSPTVLRQSDGRMWAFEGCSDGSGCCHGSCTHVWNYAQAIPHLFPALERTFRESEFKVSQDDKGHQVFRTALPIRQAVHDFHAAADGQLGGIMKAYREWRISGDAQWLRGIWPKVQESMNYCIEAWDPGHKGILEEPHHNTYDIEFWGPDGMCTSFYLGALRATAQMAKAVGESAQLYDDLYNKGTAYTEKDLYNGEYFIQKIQWEGLKAKSPLEAKSFVGAYSPEAVELLKKEGPKYQYGSGCLSDGVLGSWMAVVCGVGQVLDRKKVASHLKAVHRYNLKKDLTDHANPQRPTYACGNEGGLLLCTWPRGGALSLPFVYSNEVWTGIEYQVAAHLMAMGMVEEGLDVVKACRDRYDGRVRNPFNEYECGHWYARAMSSYALLQGLSGARYDAVEKTLYIEPSIKGDFRAFLSTAGGYGVVGVKDGRPFLEVKSGTIDVAVTRYIART